MELENKIQEIREVLVENGSDLELLHFDENVGVIKIALKGACSYSPFSRITATEFIEKKLMEDPKISKVYFQNSPY
ncbi:MAG: NifU family protein [Candidatus Aenigmarchaeota archaeon]|nr:NifU family protein [Candidatus Aenigmarchaeota archaeon]